MANITEVSQWENVIRQLENGEAATGGADGLANIQAKQLANRTKWLKDNYFPLSGALLSASLIAKNNLAGYLQINGGNTDNDAFLNLFASESPSPGEFSLRTGKNKSGGRGILEASPTSSLLWNGNDLGHSAIVAKSLGANGYVKYASGLIIQWGTKRNIAFESDGFMYCTFPIAFSEVDKYMTIVDFSINNSFPSVRKVNNSNWQFYLARNTNSLTSISFDWLAIGY